MFFFIAFYLLWKTYSLYWRNSHLHANKVKTTGYEQQIITRDKGGRLFSYKIRALKKTEIPEIMQIRREIGIHDCTSCIKSWFEIDPEGFIGAVHESGEIIGMVSAIVSSEDFAFHGLFCTREKYRSLGIGKQVRNSSAVHIANRNTGLYAVPEKVDGFLSDYPVLVDDFYGIKNISSRNVDPNILCKKLPKNVEISPFHASLLGAVVAYDKKLMGYERAQLIKLNCTEENSRTLVAMRGEDCVGFGTIKLSCLGAGRIGPLYADDNQTAEALMKELIISYPETNGFTMMTLSDNVFANNLMSKLKVSASMKLPQIYNQKRIEVDHEKIFALYDLNGAPF